jgi:hypothetical protein
MVVQYSIYRFDDFSDASCRLNRSVVFEFREEILHLENVLPTLVTGFMVQLLKSLQKSLAYS